MYIHSEEELKELREEYLHEFTAAMRNIYDEAIKRIGYHPTYFKMMLDKDGAYRTATQLIELPHQSSGFVKLCIEEAYDLTVESLVVERYPFLFTTSQVETAQKALAQYGYIAKIAEFSKCFLNSNADKSESAPRQKILPEKFEEVVTRYKRSPTVVQAAKERAGGLCELCGKPAPFIDRGGEPYLVVHHIEFLSEEGEDTIENAVAICPNCHDKMHHLALEEDVRILKEKANGKLMTRGFV